MKKLIQEGGRLRAVTDDFVQDWNRTIYHIESKAPGERKWRYRRFSSPASSSRDKDRIFEYLEKAKQNTPTGWQFRVVARQEKLYVTPWQEVTE